MVLPDLKKVLEQTALEAGEVIMEIYNAEESSVRYKNDKSPVTEADGQAEDIITRVLKDLYPEIPIIAEEAFSAGNAPDLSGSLFFLVDPLDGTKEFISKRSDFTVNIALIENQAPVAGVVYAPAQQAMWIAVDGKVEKVVLDGGKNVRTDIQVRKTDKPEIAVVSHFHNDEDTMVYLDKNNITESVSAGSSLKFCLVAEGSADVYPRFGRTMEWDTAAADAVLRAAGGRVVTTDGSLLLYGKTNQSHDTDFANSFFIADNQG